MSEAGKHVKVNLVAKILTAAGMCCLMFVLSGCCLRHQYEEATCEQPRTCTKCGAIQGEALGHQYTEATCEQPKTCIRCGLTVGSALGHRYVEATCEQPKTCTVCKATVGEAKGHSFSEATCTEPVTCVICDASRGKALGHDFSETDCMSPSVCSRCDETKPAAGHSFKPATCAEPKVCSKCGDTEGEALGHEIINGKCSRCGLSLGCLEYIASFIGRKSVVEENLAKCIVNVNNDANPYDVDYDYGADYEELIFCCDWSLVFDAEYYKKTFPMLAMQYHYDDALLLRHFQTVGIHEGRQGSAKFNVGAYLLNCADAVYNAFHREDKSSYECYYLYYMLNYDTEKEVNTKEANNGKKVKRQYKVILTMLQASELKKTNFYRGEVEAEALLADSELNAIANYRAYVNQTEGWAAHDWIIEHKNLGQQWMADQGSASFAENEVESSSGIAKVCADSYYSSPSHYEAMVATKYKYVGLGNTYKGNTKNERNHNTYTFDVYMTAVDASPLYN